MAIPRHKKAHVDDGRPEDEGAEQIYEDKESHAETAETEQLR